MTKTKINDKDRIAVNSELREASAREILGAMYLVEDCLLHIPRNIVGDNVSGNDAFGIAQIWLTHKAIIDEYFRGHTNEEVIEMMGVDSVLIICGRAMRMVATELHLLDLGAIRDCIHPMYAENLVCADAIASVCASCNGLLSEGAHNMIQNELALRKEEAEKAKEASKKDKLVADALVGILRTLDDIDWLVERKCIGADALDKISDAYVLAEIAKDAVTGECSLEDLRNEFEIIVGDE